MTSQNEVIIPTHDLVNHPILLVIIPMSTSYFTPINSLVNGFSLGCGLTEPVGASILLQQGEGGYVGSKGTGPMSMEVIVTR